MELKAEADLQSAQKIAKFLNEVSRLWSELPGRLCEKDRISYSRIGSLTAARMLRVQGRPHESSDVGSWNLTASFAVTHAVRAKLAVGDSVRGMSA